MLFIKILPIPQFIQFKIVILICQLCKNLPKRGKLTSKALGRIYKPALKSEKEKVGTNI